MKDIYFDNSSTSFPKAPNVGRAMGEFIENGAFNINRGSYEGAYEAGSAVLDTREMLKDLFNCPNSKTIVLMLPTLIASFYGMNVDIHLEEVPFAFSLIVLFSIGLSTLAFVIFRKIKWF